MSSRPSNYTERRTNGTTDSDGSQRPHPRTTSRAPPTQASTDSRSGRSPQPGYTNPPHKRSASGNPRPASRAVEERRTDRLTVTTREKLITRTSSERRSKEVPSQPEKEKWRPKDVVPKPRQPETKVRESRSEPVSSKPHHPSFFLCVWTEKN